MLLRVRLILRLKEEIFLKPMFESGESERLANTNRYVVPYFHTRVTERLFLKGWSEVFYASNHCLISILNCNYCFSPVLSSRQYMWALNYEEICK